MNIKTLFIYTLLVLSILLAIITRFYKLGEVPKGLYLDEAGQGYSAYSILKTGKDEFGMPYPFVFRSFTDFKTPIYIYLITPLIPVFGLNPFTIRFPSFLFSILTIPVLFYLIKILLAKDKRANILAVLLTLLISISPWHVLFGRTNFECNVALFFFLFGLLTFYLGLKKPIFLVLSSILFAVAIPAYHSQRIITPLMLIYLFVRFRKILFDKDHKLFFIIGIILGTIISIPTLIVSFTPGFLARASGLNIFSGDRYLSYGYLPDLNSFVNAIFNNKFLLIIRKFFAMYFSYLSPRNMFWLGDYGPRSSFPELATFFVWQFPFYLYGLYRLIRDKTLGELRKIIIFMLLISPIPGAMTSDPYSTIRALPLVIPQNMIIALGIYSIFDAIKRRLFKFIFSLILIFLFIFSIGKLYSSVIVLNEYYRASEWNYGWKEVVEEISKLDKSLPIIVDGQRTGPAYIEILFFKQYDPARYQSENKEVSNSEYYINMVPNEHKKIENIETRPINWEMDLPVHKYLIGDSLAISDQQIKTHNLKLIKDILYPNGSIAFRIVETNFPSQ